MDGEPIDDGAIQATVARLARPTASGGHAIQRAAILAEGPDFGRIEAWILEHGGEAENSAVAAGGGLHADRINANRRSVGAAPVRYVLPPGAFG
jgi:hypothetical protein